MLLTARAIAQDQPRSIDAGDGAVDQPHALVFHAQLEVAFGANLQETEVDLLGLQAQARLVEDVGGKVLKQLIETALRIGELGGRFGRDRKINTAEAAEELFQVALTQQIAG